MNTATHHLDLSLEPKALFNVSDAAGVQILCRSGSLWVTLDGDPRDHENIRVPGSHIGLGFNRHVLWIVADRLAQPEGAWRPYRRNHDPLAGLCNGRLRLFPG